MLVSSLVIHAAALAGLLAAPPPALVPAAEAAHMEVLFGNGDPRVAVPAGGGSGATARIGGADPGLRFAGPDPTVRPARDDPSNRPPPYPADAWASGQQGTVVLRLFIDERGAVARLEKLASSGYASLDAAAERALARWRFLPARQAGRPVASERIQPVRFVIQ